MEIKSKSRIRSVRILQVIAIEVCVGEGTDKNPNRLITEYWTMDGKKMAQSEDSEPSAFISSVAERFSQDL